MGSNAVVPNDDGTADREGRDKERLGDLLSGRFSDADVDSVEAVRELRERE